MKSIERLVVQIESMPSRSQHIDFGLRILFEVNLCDRAVPRLRLAAAKNDRRQRRSDSFQIFFGRVVLRRPELCQPVLGTFADIGQSENVRGGFGEAVGEYRVVEDHGRAGCAQRLDALQERFPRGRLQRHARVISVARGLVRVLAR